MNKLHFKLYWLLALAAAGLVSCAGAEPWPLFDIEDSQESLLRTEAGPLFVPSSDLQLEYSCFPSMGVGSMLLKLRYSVADEVKGSLRHVFFYIREFEAGCESETIFDLEPGEQGALIQVLPEKLKAIGVAAVFHQQTGIKTEVMFDRNCLGQEMIKQGRRQATYPEPAVDVRLTPLSELEHNQGLRVRLEYSRDQWPLGVTPVRAQYLVSSLVSGCETTRYFDTTPRLSPIEIMLDDLNIVAVGIRTIAPDGKVYETRRRVHADELLDKADDSQLWSP